ncbi:MAG: PepSY-associated TM helix domain-containing protein, partial [Methylococcaceae bacterium]
RVFYHAGNPLKHSLVGFFFKLHYALFLGDIGSTLVGMLAVLVFVSVMTGLILWWPLTGKWRRVLTIKRRASSGRFNHDLHQSAGFYSLIVLLALLLSGMYFNLPDEFRWLVERFSTLTPEITSTPAALPEASSGVLEQALRQVINQYPGGTAHYYAFSADNTAP